MTIGREGSRIQFIPSGFWDWKFLARSLAATAATARLALAAGGIATDGTAGGPGALGHPQTLTGANVVIQQSVGSTVGANLFHSFSAFNVNAGQTVTFAENVPNALDNVIARVTGGARSDIDGMLRSTSGGHADFYLVNPAGVLFGPNARLDVAGAFHVSAADELRFADGSIFGAARPEASTLTAAAPAAFGFLGSSPANNGLIDVNGAQLAVKQGETLDIVGREIGVENGAKLEAPAGEIRLTAMRGAGSAGLAWASDGNLPFPDRVPSAINAGNITIHDSIISTAGDGAGHIGAWGGKTEIKDSWVSADNIGNSNASSRQGVEIRLNSLMLDHAMVSFNANGLGSAGQGDMERSEAMEIVNGGYISGSTLGAGNAESMSIKAGALKLDNGLIFSDTYPGATGRSGNVNVVVTGALDILNGGEIYSFTRNFGEAGNVTVKAITMMIDGKGFSESPTGIFSRAIAGTGKGGNVDVTTIGELNIFNSGKISSGTFDQGNAGDVGVKVGSLNIDGQTSDRFTGISSQANAGSKGNAGNVNIVSVGAVDIVNGGQVSASTVGPGDAGDITIKAGAMKIDSQQYNKGNTGILAVATADAGKAGNVDVTVSGALDVLNGGEINRSTFSLKDAGDVKVRAGAVKIDGQGNIDRPTGILSTAERGSTGKAGDVTIVSTGAVDILDGTISSSTFGAKDAGSVTHL
jgi:filamentous hemagglutinin family protein